MRHKRHSMQYMIFSVFIQTFRAIANFASHGSFGYYSRNRSDRSGSQIHYDLMAYSYCWSRNRPYSGSIGHAYLKEKQELCTLLNLPKPKKFGIPNLHARQYSENPPHLTATAIFNEKFRNHLRSKLTDDLQMQHERIVIHIRRGDVNKHDHPNRFIDTDIYIRLFEELRARYPRYELVVHTESQGSEDVLSSLSSTCKIMLDAPLTEVWRDLITSRVCVIAKSSFSYVPALFCDGVVFYFPFWHEVPAGWEPILVDEMRLIRQGDDRIH